MEQLSIFDEIHASNHVLNALDRTELRALIESQIAMRCLLIRFSSETFFSAIRNTGNKPNNYFLDEIH